MHMSLEVTPSEVKELKQLVHRPRKYVANQIGNYVIADTVNTAGCSQLYPMLANILQGTDEFQRVGDRVTPARSRTHFTMYLDAANNFTADIYVRLIAVDIKAVKAYSSAGGYPGRDLLNKGDGTCIDPPPGAGGTYNTLAEYSKMPINTKAYSVHHDKVYRFCKNQGQLTGDGTSTTSQVIAHPSQHHVIITHKTPAQLKYDNAVQNQPNNYFPVWCAYAWTSTGAPFSGGFVNIAVRTEMSYTDA